MTKKSPAKPAKKVDAKKADAKKGSPKPAPKAPASKKPEAKKPPAKKPAPTKPEAKKPEPKKPAPAKVAAAKPAPAKPAPAKPGAKPTAPAPAKADAKKTSPIPTKPDAKAAAAAAAGAAAARKAKPPIQPFLPPSVGRLLDAKGNGPKPLIASGPKAAHVKPLGAHGGEEATTNAAAGIKTQLSPEQLEEFRQLLIRKRAELVGDVRNMEEEALRGASGSLSNMPSHLAEQGSEAYDQSLQLDLAAADRKLIKEIDDALARIANQTYGICELTGKPIKIDRLRELPWARYSIEAARELERQSMRAM